MTPSVDGAGSRGAWGFQCMIRHWIHRFESGVTGPLGPLPEEPIVLLTRSSERRHLPCTDAAGVGREIFLRPGTLARPSQKHGVDGSADYGRSPAKLARAALRTWKQTLAVCLSGVNPDAICSYGWM